MMPRLVPTPPLRRLDGDDRERGSLPFLMLVMLLTVALGGVMLATVAAQARTSTFNESRARSLDAAQGGLDHALAQIRTAVSTTDNEVGDAGRLPCFIGADWTDLGPTGTTQFKITNVSYYRTSADLSAKKAMVCSKDAGTFDADTKDRAPRFAVIEAAGRDTSRTGRGSSAGRTLETTYQFQTNDVNITGGQIRIYGAQLCMDAGATKPAENTRVTLQPCSTTKPPSEQQVFAYRSDLSIELVSSIPAAGSAGLCLDSEGTGAPAAGAFMVLKRCGAVDANPQRPNDPSVCPAGFTPATFATKNPGKTCQVSAASQRFSVDDDAHLRGSNTNADDVSGLCIDVEAQTAGTFVKLQSCGGGTTSTRQTWVPTPTAGAGSAGADNSQIVNYAQFATCIDITGQNVNADYEILYTCKQNPDPSKVRWNQKMVPSPAVVKTDTPARVLLTVKPNSTDRYCLKSPATEGGYPKLVSCPTGTAVTDDSLYWTYNQRYATAASGTTPATELAYRDRYTIKDFKDRCLAPGKDSDLHTGAYYKIVTSTCDGSTAQKWNADPSRLQASLSNLNED